MCCEFENDIYVSSSDNDEFDCNDLHVDLYRISLLQLRKNNDQRLLKLPPVKKTARDDFQLLLFYTRNSLVFTKLFLLFGLSFKNIIKHNVDLKMIGTQQNSDSTVDLWADLTNARAFIKKIYSPEIKHLIFGTFTEVGGATVFFFYNYIIKYLQQKSDRRIFFLNKKFNFSSLTDYKKEYKTLLAFFCTKLKKFQPKIGKGFFLSEFFECIFFFFISKDAVFFGN